MAKFYKERAENKANISHGHLFFRSYALAYPFMLGSIILLDFFCCLFVFLFGLRIFQLSYLFVNDYQEHLNENPRNWKYRTDTTINLASSLPVFANTSWIVFISSRLHFCTTSALCMLRPLATRCHGHMLQRHSTYNHSPLRKMLSRLEIHFNLWHFYNFQRIRSTDLQFCYDIILTVIRVKMMDDRGIYV